MRSPALDDLIKLWGYTPKPSEEAIMETILLLALFKGVKIGGIYRHFKGKMYKVKNVVRDADQWPKWRVEYVEVDDATHEASRPLDDFLGMHESGVRRFTLVT